MKYCTFIAKADNGSSKTYYVEADNLVSIEEMRDYIGQIAANDFVISDDEVEDIDVLDPTEMDEDGMLAVVADVKMRPKLILASLNNISNVVLGIYSRNNDFDIGSIECFLISAIAGQDADVTAIEKSGGEENTPVEVAINRGQIDCISQLKRYWQISGTKIATGLLIVQAITEEEYDMELSEREVVTV